MGGFFIVFGSPCSYFRFFSKFKFPLIQYNPENWLGACLKDLCICTFYIHVCTIPYQALEKAKEAGRKERVLVRQREQQSMGDQINLDLTYSVSTLLTLFMELDCAWSSNEQSHLYNYDKSSIWMCI